MTKRKFFQNFDESTLTKLQLFKYYIREWLPVNLSKSNVYLRNIAIFDFFAGKGMDESGNDGSPKIILKEIIESYRKNSKLYSNIKFDVFLNDADQKTSDELKENTDELKRELEQSFPNVHVFYFSHTFFELWNEYKVFICQKDIACLLLLDQFGFKEIDEIIFRKIISCPRTDFIFFITSNNIKRFVELEAVQKYLSIDAKMINGVTSENVHRLVCDYYRSLIDSRQEFYIAPFSIKKGHNIYGLIFGSPCLLGIEKFLKTTWGIDCNSGEANYNINKDGCYSGVPMLFEEMNIPTKLSLFEEELLECISKKTQTNRDLYRFSLERGICIKKTNEILKKLQKNKQIVVENCGLKQNIPKGAFYINWENYKKVYDIIKIRAF